MYIKVRVKTEYKKEYFEKVNENTFNVCVKEEGRNGQANQRVIEILKEELNKKNIKLISGHTSPSKIFSIED